MNQTLYDVAIKRLAQRLSNRAICHPAAPAMDAAIEDELRLALLPLLTAIRAVCAEAEGYDFGEHATIETDDLKALAREWSVWLR